MKKSELKFKKDCNQDLANTYIFRKISWVLAILLAKLKIHPTVITVLSFLTGLIAVWYILYNQLIVGAILVFVTHVLDKTDGDLARRRGMVNERGDFLDNLFDRILDSLFIVAITIALYIQTLLPLVLILGMLSLIAVFMTVIVGLSGMNSTGNSSKTEKEFLKNKPSWLLLGRGVRNLLIIIGLLLNQLTLLLLFFVVIQNLYWIGGAVLTFLEKK